MKPIDVSTIPEKAPSFHLEEIDEKIVLQGTGNGRSIILNESAALIWQLCDGTVTVRGLIEKLEAYFPEATEQIGGDVHRALHVFGENKAIKFITV